MPHSFWSRVHPRLIVCGAVLAIAQPLSAQQSRVIIAGGQGANVVTLSSLALSDTAVRRLIETHFPDAFSDDADAHHVLLVLDANGEYVSGKVSKATVVTPATVNVNGENSFVVGDSLGGPGVARVMVRRLDGGVVSTGTPPAVTIMRRNADSGVDSQHGVMGSDYDMSEVSSVGFRHFAAGQLARGMVMVSVVRLK
jgi:hypothetical protein